MNDNEIIAKFMGWKIDNSFPDKGKVWRSPEGRIELNTTMKFDTSWDWLMPVVEKIQTDHPFRASIQESHRDSYGFYSGIIMSSNWRQYYWNECDQLKLELDEASANAAKYGEVPDMKTEFRQIVTSKIEAVYKCVNFFLDSYKFKKSDKNV